MAAAVTAAVSVARLVGVDRLRAVALLLMLFHHFLGWFMGEARDVVPGTSEIALTDVAAPAFFVAAGASVALLVAALGRRGVHGWRLHGTVLRRYGLLWPLGVVLNAAVIGDAWTFGALESIAATTVAAYAISRLGRPAVSLAVAVVCLLGSEPVARWADGWPEGNLVREAFGGTFPVQLYLGFVLVGMVAAPHAASAKARRHSLGAGAVLLAGAAVVVVVLGEPLRRYPGEPAFALAGLGGTLVLYGLVARPPAASPSIADVVLRRAGAHTFGIYLAHYVVRWALDLARATGDVPVAVALPAAIVLTLGFSLAAPYVPQLPWTPRRGRRSRTATPSTPGDPLPAADPVAALVPPAATGDSRPGGR